MAHFHDNALIGASGQGGYQIERSLRFNSADSAYLNRTPASAGNRRTFTISYWIKRSALLPTSGGNPQYLFSAGSGTSESTWFQAGAFETDSLHNETNLGTWTTNALITPKFRDTSAWYHFVWSVDTTQASASNRVKVWVNGIEQPKSTPTISPNADLAWNNNVVHYIGARIDSGPRQFADCYLAEVYNIDGQALNHTSFGETDTITGVWKPKKYAGTYGTNGFYLKFADNSGTTSTTLGKDSSGNGNNFTPNNFSVTAGAGNDSMIDTPTPYADGGNGRGNYATWNPINTAVALSNGNLDIASLSDYVFGSVQVTSGKWYWEYTINGGSNYNYLMGVSNSTASTYVGMGMANGGNSPDIFNILTNTNGTKTSPTGSRPSQPATIGIKLDIGAGSVEFYINGTLNGSVTGITNWPSGSFWTPWISSYTGTFGYQAIIANFGQRAFAYTPPSGFLALNTNSLPEPSIKKPSSYFNAITYTGTGAARSVTGTGFQPDLVWTKNRSTAASHGLIDAVRGAGKFLYSDGTSAEQTYATDFVSFDADGFSLGSGSGTVTNGNGNAMVAWQWKESATPGFDIVTYTGNGTARTIAHSLGVAPSMMIIKRRDAIDDWGTYHVSLGNTQYLYLDGTQAANTASAVWNNTSPTSSVFSVGTSAVVNANTGTYVAYLFSEVAGFSRISSYVGNGSSDGPFVFCGFRPRWVMMKSSTNAATPWQIFDSARETYNTIEQTLVANGSNAEPYDTASPVDFLSNGFKLRGGGASYNNYNTGTWIFAAFAETPMKYSLAF